MLAVGVWAALSGGRAVWALPAAFVAALLAGFGLGAAGLPFPAVEPLILASVIGIGALVALAVRVPLIAAAAMMAVVGLAHGHAHGTEGPAAGLAAYALGFTLATVGLHAAGLGLGLSLAQAGRAAVTRALGGAVALGGVALAFL
jgi:urease accessory protein